MKVCTTNLANILSPEFEILSTEALSALEIPLFSTCISAGFPSPAEGYLDDKINLQQLLIKNPAATYMLRVRGDSMRDANISEGDILIVDRSLTPSDNQVIIGILNNEFTVKRLVKKQKRYYLQPENPAYPAILLSDEIEFKIWGVVIWCIHKIKATV